MRKTTSFGEYTAPELEVVSTIVEQGFTLSSGVEFQSAGEVDYGEDF